MKEDFQSCNPKLKLDQIYRIALWSCECKLAKWKARTKILPK